MSLKLVVIGSLNGQFREAFKKLATLNGKHAFAFAIIAGDLFAHPQSESPEQAKDVEALLNGQIDVALPTYFMLGKHALPENVTKKLDSASGEVCDNLSFLGKRTTIKTSEGIRLVALGGVLDPHVTTGVSKDNYLPFYSEGDAKVLRGANHADILITTQWPSNIKSGSGVELDPQLEPASYQCIAELDVALKPKYHFSTSGESFFEREPFLHTSDSSTEGPSVTRFISLASFNNSKKAKWIYAFSLDPSASSPAALPTDITASPLATQSKKRTKPTQGSSYRFSDDRGHRQPNKRQKAPPPGPSECFFCLSNPNVASHLITSIGNECYMTTAKGPLSTSDTFEDLEFPSHMLIIPLTHAPTLAFIEPEETRELVFQEMQRYRKSLNTMLMRRTAGKLGSIAWEVSRSGGIHTHWQYLPLPLDLVQRKLVEVAFEVQAENENYPSIKKKDIGNGSIEPTDFFRAIIWEPSGSQQNGEGKDTSLFLPLDASFRFDLQFGRRVLAKLLDLEKRVQWQECGQSEIEEKADADAFKKAFKDFDFSLDD
ncbi:hypothetical protein EJ05DRAFT_499207 [Pseudovirgaria hyperparasitica]|uniref:CwfJ domain-containing protein n=1 Tax=Pseudovirgaria hyperparasitica TaxID=470096 RepID=A0A6A6WAZ0_9PEZI|nr:uncharacterized protein EJ05DRAFT_499207 [Pseudovirgaria hyperparasitica]KAF2760018.1 hypothetical protein EJ05DRAFT_499207 [Pseudovirgaria hyperparasitica]